ncbi:GNAT family N-acetyltransferase [Bacillus thuringiensis]
MKSDKDQEERIQIFERWVGSNAFFLGVYQVYKFTPKAIYDNHTLIGFTSYGYRKEHERYELISMMLGHQYQGKGYGVPALQAVIAEMSERYKCKEIYLSVIHDNGHADRTV